LVLDLRVVPELRCASLLRERGQEEGCPSIIGKERLRAAVWTEVRIMIFVGFSIMVAGLLWIGVRARRVSLARR
jgi:hypothetical protein